MQPGARLRSVSKPHPPGGDDLTVSGSSSLVILLAVSTGSPGLTATRFLAGTLCAVLSEEGPRRYILKDLALEASLESLWSEIQILGRHGPFGQQLRF